MVTAGMLPSSYQDIGSLGLNHSMVGNETYGLESYIYLTVPGGSTASALESALVALKHTVDTNYSRHNQGLRVAVRVTYFRGRNWNV